MSVVKPESFARGALMLSLAGLVTRLLGAFYKPVINRIFAPFDGHGGAIGSGLTQVPLSAYMVILSFTSVGLNVGIARLVAERMALGDPQGARRVFRVALMVMVGLGLVAATAMWVGAPWIAGLISAEVVDTIPGFRATAPALVFVSIAAAYRGLFQGFQYMTPNAYSQMIEQTVRVVSGVVLTYVLVQYSIPLGAAGFNLGDVIGGVAALTYLLILVRRIGPGLWAPGVPPHPVAAPMDSRLSPLLRRIFAVAGPITIVGAVVPLMMLADTFFVLRNLPEIGIYGDAAKAQFGLLTNAFMIIYLPTVFTSAIYTSVLPAITEAITLGRSNLARDHTSQAYRLTTLLAFPAQIGFLALATGVYMLIYGDPTGGSVLAALSWAVLPIMLQQTTSGVLQGAGKIGIPVRNFLLGAVLKAVLTAIWTPLWGINGAAYATAAGFGLAALLNLYDVEKLLGRTLDLTGMVVKPLLAAVLMGGGVFGLESWLTPFGGHPTITTLLLVAIGSIVYGFAVLLLGAVGRQDVEFIPRIGPRLADRLVRAGLLR